MKKLLLLIVCYCNMYSGFSQASYEYTTSTSATGGNPGSLNTEGDQGTTGWTAISISGLTAGATSTVAASKWSSAISFPFEFYFYGEKFSGCSVTLNGLVSFTTGLASTAAPTANNSSLPSSSLPNKTIACYWDQYYGKSAGDWVYTKKFGSSPNRQFWIKWHSMRMSGSSSENAGYALVFEETTNNIYFVDLYKGTKTVAATLGVQYNTSTYYNISSTANVASTSTAYTTNSYKTITPSRITYAEVSYTYASLKAASTPIAISIVPDLSVPSVNTYQLSKATLKVQLDAGETYNYGANAFNSSVEFSIKGYDKTSRSTDILTPTGNGIFKKLEISQSSPEKLLSIDITDKYTNLDVISLTITNTTLDQLISNNLRFRAWIETEYAVGADKITTAFLTSEILLATTAVNTANGNPLTFSWQALCSDIPYTEFQLLRLYNNSVDITSTEELNVAAVDWNKSLSIILNGSKTSLSLNVNEGSGYYAWRVRPIGNYYDGGVANSQNWGNWSVHPEVEEGLPVIKSSASGLPTYMFYLNQPEEDKNFIYSRTFTEDSRMSENMTYADQLLNIRQTQHKIQSDDNALVGQVVYDFLGRDAIKSLASPVSSSNLAYQKNYLASVGKVYNATNFDAESNYLNPQAVDATSPVSKFYSNSNTDLTIPNANNYPFSRVRYDASGRVIEVGQAGEISRIGGGSLDDEVKTSRTIKTYYTPITDDELVKVFANEAPSPNSVHKIITTDPNNLTTVTYQRDDGKILATCLSGESYLTEPLIYSKSTVSKIIDIDNTLDANTFEKSELLPPLEDGFTLKVNYSLTPAQIEADCGTFCTTCDYKVEVYVKNVETNEKVIIGNLEYGPSKCGTLSEQTIGEQTISGLDGGSYIIGRTLKVNNTNAATQQKYQDEHIDHVSDNIKTNFDDRYADLYSLLEANDLDGFYDSLVSNYSVDPNYLKDGNSITLETGCCPITFTVEKCTNPCENGIPDFEAMLYERWGNIYGYTPYAYFYKNTEGSMFHTYEQNYSINDYAIIDFGAFTGSEGDKAYITLQAEITNDDGSIMTFDFLGGENKELEYVSDGSTGAAVLYNVYVLLEENVKANYRYSGREKEVFENFPFYITTVTPTQLQIGSNLANGGPASCKIILKLTNIGASINDPNLSIVAADDTKPVAGMGMFNTLVNNMINDGGYACDSLYYAWKSLVESYASSQFLIGSDAHINSTLNDYNLLEAFLKAVGKKYAGFSNVAYGFNTYDPTLVPKEERKYGYGYLEYAYKSFYFDTVDPSFPLTDYANCINATLNEAYYPDGYFVVDEPFSWPADERFEDSDNKTWENFYNCTNGGVPDAASDKLSELGFSTADCDATDADCIISMLDVIKDTCETYCGYRYNSFVSEAENLFESKGIIYTMGDVICMANTLVEQCKQACSLTIDYTDVDKSGGFNNGDEVNSVGTDKEIASMQKALTYGIELALLKDCNPSYTSVSGTRTYFKDEIVDDLNKFLANLIQSGSTKVLTSAITQKIEDAYLEFIGSPFSCDIVATATDFTINSSSYLELVSLGVHKNELVLHYVSGITKIWDFDEGCDVYKDCNVCYKWVPIEIAATDTGYFISCEEHNTDAILASFNDQLDKCVEAEVESFENLYTSSCIESISDQLSYSYEIGYHHYTLYYYDRVGNLIKTVPPKAISDDYINADGMPYHFPYSSRETQYTSYTYKTTYEYNSLGQLIATTSPDAGTVTYYYNKAGQLRFSQNAQQLADNKYSYVKYDNLGRAIEAGQASISSLSDITSVDDLTLKVDESSLPSNGEQRTYTKYSEAFPSLVYDDNAGNTEEQQHLLNRISYTYNDDAVYTFYSYDAHGSVSWMIQRIPDLGMDKYIKYEYDLVSSKVTEVKYNENRADQFYHKYSYDEDNRLSKVQTSVDGIIWDTDATYAYNLYGPLKRVEIGEDKIQGLDYVYTIQGWLKAINHPMLNAAADPGKDGASTSEFAPDAFGTVINYYDGDFNRTGSTLNNVTEALFSSLNSSATVKKSYYNGLISSIVSNNAYQGTDVQYANKPMASMFLYDDWGRLIQSTIDFYSGTTPAWGGSSGSSSIYYEKFGYDDNGNIKTVLRNGY